MKHEIDMLPTATLKELNQNDLSILICALENWDRTMVKSTSQLTRPKIQMMVSLLRLARDRLDNAKRSHGTPI